MEDDDNVIELNTLRGVGRRNFNVKSIRLALIEARGLIARAAEILEERTGQRCPISTIRSAIERNPALNRVIQDERVKINCIAEQNIINGILKGEYRSSVRWLEKYGGWAKGDRSSDDIPLEQPKSTESQIIFVDPPNRESNG